MCACLLVLALTWLAYNQIGRLTFLISKGVLYNNHTRRNTLDRVLCVREAAHFITVLLCEKQLVYWL